MSGLPSRERLQRIHALCGVFPLGVFVAAHLLGNATALWGRGRFEAHLGWVEGLPLRPVVEVVGILLPLLVHVAIGVRLVLDPAASIGPEPATRDGWRTLQRASGLLALVFVAVHLGHYRWPRLSGELQMGELYDRLAMDLQGMGRFAFYLAGTSAVVFHLASGIVRFLLPAGHRVPEHGRRRITAAVGVAGLLLWLVSLEILGHYYAGGSMAASLGLLRSTDPGGSP